MEVRTPKFTHSLTGEKGARSLSGEERHCLWGDLLRLPFPDLALELNEGSRETGYDTTVLVRPKGAVGGTFQDHGGGLPGGRQ